MKKAICPAIEDTMISCLGCAYYGLPDLHRSKFGVNDGFLLSPVVSLDAQSVDPRPSCEACLCRAECIRFQLSPDARSELRAAGHESLDTSKCPWCDDSLYLKKKGHEQPSARAATPERGLGHAVRPGTGTRM